MFFRAMATGLVNRFKKSFITHIVLAYIFLSSGLIVNFLEFLALPLWYLGYREQYRKLISKLTYLSWARKWLLFELF